MYLIKSTVQQNGTYILSLIWMSYKLSFQIMTVNNLSILAILFNTVLSYHKTPDFEVGKSNIGNMS